MAARQAWQGWRNGEFGVLLAALFVAVLALAGVRSIAQRTTDALAEQSRRLVGGDAAFSSDAGNVEAAITDAQRQLLARYILQKQAQARRLAREQQTSAPE